MLLALRSLYEAQAQSNYLAATEGADTAAFSGAIANNGTLNGVGGADTASFTGAVAASGTLSGIEGADSGALSGSIATQGALSGTEGADSANVLLVMPTNGQLAATEGADTGSISLAQSGVVLLARGDGTKKRNWKFENSSRLEPTAVKRPSKIKADAERIEAPQAKVDLPVFDTKGIDRALSSAEEIRRLIVGALKAGDEMKEAIERRHEHNAQQARALDEEAIFALLLD